MKNEQVERRVWAGKREEGGPKREAVNRNGTCEDSGKGV